MFLPTCTHTIASNSKNNSDEGGGRELWEKVDMIIVRMVVMVSQVYGYPQTP